MFETQQLPLQICVCGGRERGEEGRDEGEEGVGRMGKRE